MDIEGYSEEYKYSISMAYRIYDNALRKDERVFRVKKTIIMNE